jgi:hypothetical protein
MFGQKKCGGNNAEHRAHPELQHGYVITSREIVIGQWSLLMMEVGGSDV